METMYLECEHELDNFVEVHKVNLTCTVPNTQVCHDPMKSGSYSDPHHAGVAHSLFRCNFAPIHSPSRLLSAK